MLACVGDSQYRYFYETHFPPLSVPSFRRVSLINFRGSVVLDVYVRPTMPVTDYRVRVFSYTEHMCLYASLIDFYDWH